MRALAIGGSGAYEISPDLAGRGLARPWDKAAFGDLTSGSRLRGRLEGR